MGGGEIAREACGSVRMGINNPKGVWSNDQIKEDTWKEVLGARDEDAEERCLKVYNEDNRKVKRCIYLYLLK